MDLYEWTKHYIKFRNCVKKNIIKLELENNKIITKEKDIKKTYLISENIINSIKKIDKGITIIVCLNTKENIENINNNWNLFSKKKELTIICVKPDTNEKWSIHPATHNKISENIKKGLETLYESINGNK